MTVEHIVEKRAAFLDLTDVKDQADEPFAVCDVPAAEFAQTVLGWWSRTESAAMYPHALRVQSALNDGKRLPRVDLAVLGVHVTVTDSREIVTDVIL